MHESATIMIIGTITSYCSVKVANFFGNFVLDFVWIWDLFIADLMCVSSLCHTF